MIARNVNADIAIPWCRGEAKRMQLSTGELSILLFVILFSIDQKQFKSFPRVAKIPQGGSQ